MRKITIFSLLTLTLMMSADWPASAQSKWRVPDAMKGLISYVKEPVYPDIKDDPALPRVLIVGDSISMYYTPEVRHLLSGKANVFRIPDNGKNTGYGLQNIDYWLGDGRWAVIHFNFGLHDIVVMPATGKQQVSIEQYGQNLRELIKKFSATGAKLIWASTTPVPEGTQRRHEPDVVAYNAVAKKIAEGNQIPINDLHAFVEAHKDQIGAWQYPANVHFRGEGSVELAGEVTKHISAALAK